MLHFMQFRESAGQGYFLQFGIGQASSILADVDVSGDPVLGSEEIAESTGEALRVSGLGSVHIERFFEAQTDMYRISCVINLGSTVRIGYDCIWFHDLASAQGWY